MEADLGTRLLKMLLVLLLGGRVPDGAAPEAADLRAFRPDGAPVYAEIDLTRLRGTVADAPELAEMVFEGAEREAAFEAAAAAVGLVIGAGTREVAEAFANVRRAGVWLVAFGERADRFRFLAVMDVGGAREVLSGLLAGAGRIPGYHRTEYAGTTLHGFATGGGRGVWCAESRGLVALALDPLAVQGFILRAAGPEDAPLTAAGDERPVLEAEVDCRAFINMLMPAINHSARDEFLAASALLDFPSWRRATATYDGERLEARLELDPRSPVARALRQPAAPPGLMDAVPDDCGLALVAGLEDARVGWEFVTSAVAFATEVRRPGAGLDLVGEVREATGLDAAKDIFGNIVAGAVIVPKFERIRDLEQGCVLLFEVADGPAAEIAIEMFAAAMGKGEVDVREEGGATIWRGRGGRGGIAIRGTTVVVAPGSESPLEAVLVQLGKGPSELARSLSEAHPRATAFAAVDFSRLGEAGVLAGLGRRSVGFSFSEGTLRASVEVGMPEVAKIASGVASAEKTRAARRGCMLGLRRVYVAAYRYAATKGGFPESMDQMRVYLRGSTGVCALSGKPFVYRSELAGRGVRDFADRSQVVVAHAPPGAHPDGGAVVYLNGRAEWLTPERLDERVAELDRKAREEREEREERERPEREPEPVF